MDSRVWSVWDFW